MLTLKDTQLVLLSAAAQRRDRIIAPPAGVEGRAATKLFRPLLKQKLVEEVPAVNGHSVFRRDRAGDALALRITDDGLAAIGIDPAEMEEKHGASSTAKDSSDSEERQAKVRKKSPRKPAPQRKPKGKAEAAPPKTRSVTKSGPGGREASRASRPDKPGAARSGSKQALLVSLLQKKQGVEIDAIVRATGWLPHTARAMISGLRKGGLAVELERREDAKSVYRIVTGPKRSSARKTA